jgi:hypothetical protein
MELFYMLALNTTFFLLGVHRTSNEQSGGGADMRVSPAARRKWMFSDSLRALRSEMRLAPSPAVRRKVTGPSAETQTCRKYAPGLRLCGRSVDAQSVRSLPHRTRCHLAARLHRGHRFGGQRFRVCAAAFAINGAAACSARALTGGGWVSAPPSMASYPTRGRP